MFDPMERDPNLESREPKKEVPLREQPLERRGYFSASRTATGEDIVGTLYSLENKEYVLTDGPEGRLVIFHDIGNGEFPVVVDQNIIEQVLQMDRKDHSIFEARKAYAKEMANGDLVLEEVLIGHMDFNNGHISKPEVQEGINFYQLGRNASHDFYAGTKDGKKYVYTFGEISWDEKTDRSEFGGHVSEVDDWGYM